MSKREHNITSEEPLQGLVFYAPLSQGDLTDHVSGATGYSLNAPYGNLVWDSNVGAYRIYVTSRYNNALIFPITNYQSRFGSSNNITYSLYIRKRTSIIYHFTMGYAKTGDDNTFDYGYPVSHLNSFQNQVSTTQFDRFTFVFNGDELTLDIYKNNVVIHHATLPSENVYFPQNWKEHYWDNITLAGVLGGNFKTDAYFKECKIFNKALTASEVAEL